MDLHILKLGAPYHPNFNLFLAITSKATSAIFL